MPTIRPEWCGKGVKICGTPKAGQAGTADPGPITRLGRYLTLHRHTATFVDLPSTQDLDAKSRRSYQVKKKIDKERGAKCRVSCERDGRGESG